MDTKNIYVHTCACSCMHIHIHMHVHLYIFMCISYTYAMYTYTCTYMFLHISYVHMRVDMYAHSASLENVSMILPPRRPKNIAAPLGCIMCLFCVPSLWPLLLQCAQMSTSVWTPVAWMWCYTLQRVIWTHIVLLSSLTEAPNTLSNPWGQTNWHPASTNPKIGNFSGIRAKWLSNHKQ